MANIADQVKSKLRAIAHSTTERDAKTAVEEFLQWDQCKGRMRNWFTSTRIISLGKAMLINDLINSFQFTDTWYPEIKKWSLAYRPNDLSCNTNNGTERINKELKHGGYLDGSRNSLSTLIEQIIFHLIPTMQETYEQLNVQ